MYTHQLTLTAALLFLSSSFLLIVSLFPALSLPHYSTVTWAVAASAPFLTFLITINVILLPPASSSSCLLLLLLFFFFHFIIITSPVSVPPVQDHLRAVHSRSTIHPASSLQCNSLLPFAASSASSWVCVRTRAPCNSWVHSYCPAWTDACTAADCRSEPWKK